MFTEADLIVDPTGKPILVLPEKLPRGNNVVILRDGKIDVAVDGRLLGRISGVDLSVLVALSSVPHIGICTYNAAKGDPVPSRIECVARIEDELDIKDFIDIRATA